MRIVEIRKHGKSKRQKEVSKMKGYISIILWLVDKNSCIWAGNTRCMKRNSELTEDCCIELREKLRRLKGSTEASHAIKTLFTVDKNISTERPRSAVRECEDDKRSDSGSGDNDEYDSELRTFENHWVCFNYGGFSSIEYQIATVLEVTSFCLLETVVLRFMSYVLGRWDVTE